MKHIQKFMFEEIIINVIFMIFVILLLFSSYGLYKTLKEDKEQSQIFESLQEIVVEDVGNIENKENTEEIKEENKTRNLQELYNQNNDFVGWLQIENTNINYPVMQSKDRKNYYLKRNFYKKYSSLGTPYIAEYCDINASDNCKRRSYDLESEDIVGYGTPIY